MAMNKLERIEKDIEKTKGKIAELQKQLRELEAAKTEQENLQIVQLVRGLNICHNGNRTLSCDWERLWPDAPFLRIVSAWFI